jgi:hypothetical protein
MQAAAGILVSGQQLWAEACLLGSPDDALGDMGMQQYIAALGHVRFVACAMHAALCCGATSAPSVEAELCRTLAQSEEAWRQATSGECLSRIFSGAHTVTCMDVVHHLCHMRPHRMQYMLPLLLNQRNVACVLTVCSLCR